LDDGNSGRGLEKALAPAAYLAHISAGDGWATQMFRQMDATVFKKYSRIKLQKKREALAKPNRKANEPESGPKS
jgi:hypothetical protein